MAAKPTNLAAWNTGGANNVEPSSGEKVTGWTVGQAPPSSYFNWWQRLIWQWIVYLDDLRNIAWTWTAAHIFSNIVTFNERVHAIAAPGSGNANVNVENLDTTADSYALRVRSSSVGTSVRVENSSTGRGLQIQTTNGAGAHMWLVPNTTLPPNPVEGDIVYMGTGYNMLYVYNGTSWNACW